ncbi:ABC transporter permease subunit [Actinoplanes subtropicus]|uniref:ABC transporter permease subunit n=1 Tax=Actinoplanes subtropicus TaxID=543632 RepID=UPI000555DCF7|nr:ABC transporter permease subunit [Actinoplanes subtropicus]
MLAAGCDSARPTGDCPRLLDAMGAATGGLSAADAALLVLPVLLGVFVGAPLLARELESGTFRFAWTQGVGRRRWLLGKLAVLGGTAVLLSAGLGGLAAWYAQPLEAVGLSSRWQSGPFNDSAVTLPAWTLCAVAAGTLIGLLVGRTVEAMGLAAAVLGAVAAVDLWWLHSALLGVGARSMSSAPSGTGLGTLNTAADRAAGPRLAGAWLLRGWYVGPDGGRLNGSEVSSLWDDIARAGAGKDPGPWLAEHRYTYWVSYQAAGRYWQLQLAQAAIALGVGAVLVLATVRLARRR